MAKERTNDYRSKKFQANENDLKMWRPIKKLIQSKRFFFSENTKNFQFYQINVHLKDFFRGRILKIETKLQNLNPLPTFSPNHPLILRKNRKKFNKTGKFWAKLKGFFFKFYKNKKNVLGIFLEPGLKDGFSFIFFENLTKKHNFLRIKIKQKQHRFFSRTAENIYFQKIVSWKTLPNRVNVSIKLLNGKVIKILIPTILFGIKKVIKNLGMPLYRRKNFGKFFIKYKIINNLCCN